MAQQGNIRDVVTITSLVDFFPPVTENHLVDPASFIGPVGLLSAPISNRFPVPATASGFLTDTVLEIDPNWVVPGPGFTRSITGILAPLSDILEPNLGQIWPR